jgi:hypothetical protein
VSGQDNFYYDVLVKKAHQVDTKHRQGVISADDVSDALTRVEKFISQWDAVIVSAKVYLIKTEGDMELLLQTSFPPKKEEPKSVTHVTKTSYPSQYGMVFRPQVYSLMRLEESK